MRYIYIPNDIAIHNWDEKETSAGRSLTFREFFSGILMDPKFGESAEGIFLVADLREKLKDRRAGDVDPMELSEDEWNKLVAIMKKPTNPYVPLIASQCTAFLRCVLDAPTSKKPMSA
jgi:hypothetical protein